MSLPSIARCIRSQVVNGSRLIAATGTSARSIAAMPKPPACSTRLSAFTARSSVRSRRSSADSVREIAAPRIHSSRSRSIPAAIAEPTSRRSNVSTSATTSPRRVAAAIICSSTVVRPVERGPTSSDNCPRGRPPRRQRSSAAMSVLTRADGSLRSSGGSAVVSVRSSLRSRRAASRTASGLRFPLKPSRATPSDAVFAMSSPYGENIAKTRCGIKR